MAQSDHANQVVAVTTIRAALARLTPRQRLAVVLRHLVDLSTADVAEAMGCAEGAVRLDVDPLRPWHAAWAPVAR